MRTRLEKWLNSVWYRQAGPPVILRLLEPVYQYFSAHGKKSAVRPGNGLPLVVVGNISVGGTGKTPVVIALVKQLQAMGLKPGVISRGYGRKSAGLHRVQVDDSADQCGDECLLIKRQTDVPVLVAEDRQQAIVAMAAAGVDLIVADDGLQSLGAQADYRICVVDGQRLFGNGHLLPAGPLREPLSQLNHVERIIVNADARELKRFLDYCKHSNLWISEKVISMQLMPEGLYRLSAENPGSYTAENLSNWQGIEVYAVAAIGNPQRFARTLSGLGLKPELRAFPDHHNFSVADFTGLTDKAIIMTSKDAVKCAHLGLENVWVLPVSAKLEAAVVEGIIEQVFGVREKASARTAREG